MAEGRLQRTRDNYPEGLPQFGAADPYGWFREALRQQDLADNTVTMTREELGAQLEEIAKKNDMTADEMALAIRLNGGRSQLDNVVEFYVLAALLQPDDPLSVVPR